MVMLLLFSSLLLLFLLFLNVAIAAVFISAVTASVAALIFRCHCC
jgi:hypothetical protein